MKSFPVLTCFVAACLLGSLSAAQTTHVVDLNSTTFSPSAVTIDVGDTVLWNWVVSFHNVESGIGGTADGAFSSGFPVQSPATFSVVFDQAFLDANPRPCNIYDYYCIVHLPGMVGTISVRTPALTASSVFRNDMGGSNPSVYTALNAPIPGSTFDATIDTTGQPGAVGAFLVGFATPLEFPSQFGVVLVNITDPGGILINELGLGALASYSAAVPNDPALCGLALSTQGVIFGGGVTLTNAYDLVVGL